MSYEFDLFISNKLRANDRSVTELSWFTDRPFGKKDEDAEKLTDALKQTRGAEGWIRVNCTACRDLQPKS